MKDRDKPRCTECKKGICFPMPTSNLEASLHNEKFKCDYCGAIYIIAPQSDDEKDTGKK